MTNCVFSSLEKLLMDYGRRLFTNEFEDKYQEWNQWQLQKKSDK